MVITCPTCGHQGNVDSSKIPPQGAKAKCPKCQNGFLIQRPVKQQPESPAAPPVVPGPATKPPEVSVPPPREPEPTPQPLQQEPPAQAAAPTTSTTEASLGLAGSDPAPAPQADGGLSLKGPSPEQSAIPKDVACTGCLKLYKEDEITRVGERNLCQSCQEAFQSKGQTPIQEKIGERSSYSATARKPRLEYAGFWIRVGAYLVDGFLLGLVFWFIISPLFMKMFSNTFSSMSLVDPSTMDQAQMQAMMADMASKMMRAVWITNLVNMILMGAYFIILEGGPGQTLGKKALGLRVVTPDGERIGYLKAFARYIGRIISGAILCIGFIMAAFDDEKRTLHDRMCDTRVVKV